jgi:hypothetical protein
MTTETERVVANAQAVRDILHIALQKDPKLAKLSDDATRSLIEYGVVLVTSLAVSQARIAAALERIADQLTTDGK